MTVQVQSSVLRRIHIIGGPGSGKTVLARRLGTALNIPVYELDKVAFEGPNVDNRPLAARLADVHDIAKQPAWVTEGIFLGWTDELLRNADVIIWLDYVSWRLALRRISVRFINGGWQEVKRQQGIRKFTRFRDYARNLRQLIGVFFSSRHYYTNPMMELSDGDLAESRTATARVLEPYWTKVVHCQTLNKVQSVMDEIMAKTQHVPSTPTA